MHKLGIIVPYRGRKDQLKVFTKHITEYLKDIKFELIVVEQEDSNDFNRGKLLNIGFLKAEALGCDYVVFHDVDMLPISADYTYSEKPQHLISDLDLEPGTTRDNFDEYFGGVTLFPSNIFKRVNGYTNRYYGWGFEDDNLLLRCKEQGVALDRKKVIQKSRDGIGAKLNGTDAFVASPNIFNTIRDFTIFINFSIDKVKCNTTQITDDFSIFSIPGFDTTLTYNSFRNFAFQFWKKDLSSMNIPSDHYPEGTYSVIVTIENKSKPKLVTLYINGTKIGELPYDKLYDIKKEKYFYLGVGDPNREEKQNWLNGTLNTFAIYDSALTVLDIDRISKNVNKSLFGLGIQSNLKTYYDFKFIKGNTVLDLSENGNTGYAYNCQSTVTTFESEKTVSIPSRREGKFKVLPHEENGYTSGYWVSWKSRENQIDYYKKYTDKRTNLEVDGLSTLEFQTIDTISKDNKHTLKVALT